MQTNGVPATISTLRSNLAAYRNTTPHVRGGSAFLNFSKGEWTYGRTRAPFDLETIWIVNPGSLFHGWICWRNNAIAHEVVAPIGQLLPAETELPEPPPIAPGSTDREGYQYQLGFRCACIEGSLKGDETMFKSSSTGGTNALDKFIEDLTARLDECEATGSEAVFPVVQFGTDSYLHKVYSKVWVPLINIIGFSSNKPGEEVEWLEAEEEAPPPPPPPKPVRLRRVAK